MLPRSAALFFVTATVLLHGVDIILFIFFQFRISAYVHVGKLKCPLLSFGGHDTFRENQPTALEIRPNPVDRSM